MKQALSVVTLEQDSDVAIYVGPEYSLKSTSDYEQKLDRLYSNQEYSIKVGMEMKKRIVNNFGFKRAIGDMKNIFSLANQEFEKRRK